MSIVYENKQETIRKFATHKEDTGSSEVQIAILTEKINSLSTHMNLHTKDYHSRRGLIGMVNRRRKLLDYLKRKDASKYAQIIAALGLRR